MWLLSCLRQKRIIQSRSDWTRKQVLAYQQARFRDLLRYLWAEAPFYRDFYAAHGIRENHLADVSVRDLPIINKEILMDNFDRISKDPVLRRSPIEAWIHSDVTDKHYENRYFAPSGRKTSQHPPILSRIDRRARCR